MTDQTNTSAETETNAAEVAPKVPHPSIAAVKAKFDNLVDFKVQAVHFKTDKELGFKRPSFEVSMPVPSVEGFIAILENGGKGLELLQEAAESLVYSQLRSQINDLLEKGGDIDETSIDISKLTWDYIATLSKEDKRAAQISKETWDDFSKDYIEVVVRITGKDLEKVALAAKNFTTKLAKVRGKKTVLKFLSGQLDIWFSNTARGEDFAEVYSLLDKKVKEFMQEDEDSLLANLGGDE